MSAPATSVPFVPARFSKENCADRPLVQLRLHAEGNTVHVWLTVPLDSRFPGEREAREAFGDSLTLDYEVSIDLRASAAKLGGDMTRLYATSLGGRLKEDDPALNLQELQEILDPFATHGRSVYVQLFENWEPREFTPAQVPFVRAAIRSALSRPQVISITYPPWPATDLPILFPWVFLYDREYDHGDRSQLDLKRFWGFRHQIQQELPGTAKLRKLSPRPCLVAAIDPVEDSPGRHSDKGHPFALLGERLKPISCWAEFEELLKKFDADGIYFYGHASHDDPPLAATSWLEFQRVRLLVSQLLEPSRSPHFEKDLVVAFFNGCRAGQLSVWSRDSIAGFFCHHAGTRNKVCSVAPVAEVPGAFAAEFASQFWKHFLFSKIPVKIGAALLWARWRLLRDKASPLGLLYTLFGRVETHVPREALP